MSISGKRILITRPRAKAEAFSEMLQALGAFPVIFPSIEISPARDPGALDRALAELHHFDWVIFTSANAVDAVWARPLFKKYGRWPAFVRVAAIGPQTGRRLQDCGVTPDYIPDTYVAEAIVPGLGELRGCRVLLPLADIATSTLPEAIRTAGGLAEVVTAYHTIPAQDDHHSLRVLQNGLDAVTFTSGSTVRNFVTIVEDLGLNPRRLPGAPSIACIGPKTARVAVELGFGVDILPELYTVESLVQALQAYFQEQNHTGER